MVMFLGSALPGFGAPDGPNSPFGTDVWVFDVIRCSVLGLAAICLVLTVLAVWKSYSLAQAFRLTTTALMIIIIASIEGEHFGDYANWRLGMSELALLGSTWGMWAYLRFELPTSGARILRRDERRAAHKAQKHNQEDEE